MNYRIKPIQKIIEDLTNVPKCINGHYLTESNIMRHKHYGQVREQCRECKRNHDKQYIRVNGVIYRTKHLMWHRSGKGLLGGANKSSREYYKENRQEILNLLGNKCVKCNFSDSRALQIDHINGGGVKELRKLSTSLYFTKIKESIKNNSNEYQLLCANCNWIKRIENNENPNMKKSQTS